MTDPPIKQESTDVVNPRIVHVPIMQQLVVNDVDQTAHEPVQIQKIDSDGPPTRPERETRRDHREEDWQRRRDYSCLLYTSPSPRDGLLSRMPSSA